MAVLKHIASKNADYRAAFQYLVYQHNEFTQKPILDENNRPLLREEYYMDGILCKPEGFARACKKTNAKHHKKKNKEDSMPMGTAPFGYDHSEDAHPLFLPPPQPQAAGKYRVRAGQAGDSAGTYGFP